RADSVGAAVLDDRVVVVQEGPRLVAEVDAVGALLAALGPVADAAVPRVAICERHGLAAARVLQIAWELMVSVGDGRLGLRRVVREREPVLATAAMEDDTRRGDRQPHLDRALDRAEVPVA